MATYNEIREYILQKYNISVQTCWIAHVKEKYSLTSRIAPNRIDKNNRVKPCPKDKEKYIEDTFRFFKMI